MTDFFISYTAADQQWAEWIAFVLEEAGFRTKIQAWDFRPGSNFVMEMQLAAESAERTVMVLSPDYLKSQFTSPEWAAAFANDPKGLERKLVPVVVRDCNPTGLLKPLVHIKLAHLSEEDARERLIAGVKTERAKPANRPAFPGIVHAAPPKAFPGETRSSATSPSPYLPKIKKVATDVDKRRFIKAAFQQVKSYFDVALKALEREHEGFETDLSERTNVEFVAEIFAHGKSVAVCKICEGGDFSQNGITYAEGRQGLVGNGYNELLTITEDNGDLALSAQMGAFGFTFGASDLDHKHLSIEQAGEYLWRRFVGRLERQ